jgi:hypothetical protein
MDDPSQYRDILAMTFESHETNIGSNMAQLYRGWFTPPATANYRFHQSCDDHCNLKLGNTPDQSTETTEYLNIDNWAEYRRVSYSTYGGQTRISEWVALEAGRKYYVESAHHNGGGGAHFSTGVEIEQEVLNPSHPNNVKEVQKLSFNTDDVREMHRLTILNPDDGTFRF